MAHEERNTRREFLSSVLSTATIPLLPFDISAKPAPFEMPKLVDPEPDERVISLVESMKKPSKKTLDWKS